MPTAYRLSARLRSAALVLLFLVPAHRSEAQGPPSIDAFPFRIRYTPGTVRFAERIAALANATPPLSGIPDADWRRERIDIVLAPSEQAFAFATAGHAPEWGAGVAIPDRSLIVLPTFASVQRGTLLDIGTVLRHEIAHIALHRAVAPAAIPRWFDEGYASWTAHELDAGSAWMLRLAFATGRAPPLDSLELDWPSGSSRAQLAYLLSATVVEYLVSESGTHGLELLIARWKAEENFGQALAETYGVDVARLESEWRTYVKRRYGWTVVLSQSLVVGLFSGTIVLALYLVRRRRDRRKLAALRATDPPPAPAYWSESGPEIIAHRGYSARAPENTLASMNLALECGASALEFDVRATRDGIIVVFHDEKLERTTNGHGRVADINFRDLRELDAGRWYTERFKGERVPAFAELLLITQARADRLYIELKPDGFTLAQLRDLVELIGHYGFTRNCVVMSFDWQLLEGVRTLSSAIQLAFLADDEPAFRRAVERASADGHALVDCNYRVLLIRPELVRLATQAGIELAVYTVNETVTAAALLSLGVRRITTNEVERMLRWAAGRDFAPS